MNVDSLVLTTTVSGDVATFAHLAIGRVHLASGSPSSLFKPFAAGHT
jgi:hypothetical protein